MTSHVRALKIVLAFLLVGCSGTDMVARFTPPDADVRARNYLALFVHDRVDSAAGRLVPALQTQETEAQLKKIAELLHNQRFDTTRVVGASTNTINAIRHVNLAYELHSPTGWLLTNVATVDSAKTWFVEGISAHTMPGPLEVETQFTFAGRSAVYFVWLVLLGAVVIISLGTALFIATRRGMPNRWIWTVVACLGGGAFRLNWATGAINVNPFSVQVPSGSIFRAGPAAPWVFTFALPIGAVFALRRYREWRVGTERSATD